MTLKRKTASAVGAILLLTTMTGFAPVAAEEPDPASAGPIALYDFNEIDGDIVHDSSGWGAPLDLVIDDSDNVDWTGGSLRVNGEATISSIDNAEKITDAAVENGVVTVEVWASTDDTEQSGPARLVSVSSSTSRRNLTVGQETSEDGGQVDVRLRSTDSDLNGRYDEPMLVDAPNLGSQMTHVVVSANAGEGIQIYIDGTLVEELEMEGDFSNWDPSMGLHLANEATGSRGWAGELHSVAFYAMAATPEIVADAYAAGPVECVMHEPVDDMVEMPTEEESTDEGDDGDAIDTDEPVEADDPVDADEPAGEIAVEILEADADEDVAEEIPTVFPIEDIADGVLDSTDDATGDEVAPDFHQPVPECVRAPIHPDCQPDTAEPRILPEPIDVEGPDASEPDIKAPAVSEPLPTDDTEDGSGEAPEDDTVEDDTVEGDTVEDEVVEIADHDVPVVSTPDPVDEPIDDGETINGDEGGQPEESTDDGDAGFDEDIIEPVEDSTDEGDGVENDADEPTDVAEPLEPAPAVCVEPPLPPADICPAPMPMPHDDADQPNAPFPSDEGDDEPTAEVSVLDEASDADTALDEPVDGSIEDLPIEDEPFEPPFDDQPMEPVCDIAGDAAPAHEGPFEDEPADEEQVEEDHDEELVEPLV